MAGADATVPRRSDVDKADKTAGRKVADQARSDLETASAKATEAGGELKDEAEKQIGDIQAKAATAASEQKDIAADRINGFAAALKDTAENLDQRNETAVAGYARDLAGGVERFSKTLKDRELGDLMGTVEDFGRRQPAAFLGIAALVGFASGRFAVASAEKRERLQSSRPVTEQRSPKRAAGLNSTRAAPARHGIQEKNDA